MADELEHAELLFDLEELKRNNEVDRQIFDLSLKEEDSEEELIRRIFQIRAKVPMTEGLMGPAVNMNLLDQSLEKCFKKRFGEGVYSKHIFTDWGGDYSDSPVGIDDHVDLKGQVEVYLKKTWHQPFSKP